ncbi:MAG: hypothetical protein ACHQ03_01640 [Candidatus Bathyarchaeia archaeon]
MGRLFIVISDEIERRLRLAVVIRGGRKGDLSATIELAVNEWLKTHEKQIKKRVEEHLK